MASRSSSAPLRLIAWLLAALSLMAAPAMAANVSFTVTTSEPATVTGAPRIAIDVGGVTRHAAYASGSGTTALVFSYAVQPGDFDMNGIAVASPLDLNGGTITDLAGNPLSSLAFAAPATASLKVQTYTAAFATNPITSANANAVSFSIDKAPVGGTFNYTISSSGGGTSVSGSGTIASLSQSVGADVSGLPPGTLTLSVIVSTAAGGTGTARNVTTTPALTGPLDGLPTPAAAYSVRRLRGAYTGPLMRVRRSTDSAEHDIGALLGGDLDTVTLSAFCGAASCSVLTWYDQAPLGRHMNQASAQYQPVIMSSGALQTEGGRPALRFISGAEQYLEGPVMITQIFTSSINAVARCADTTADRHVMGDRGLGTDMGRVMRALSGGGGYLGANVGGASVTMPGSTAQQHVITLVSGTSGISGALDGVLRAGGTSTIFQTSSYPYRIGGGGAGQSAAGDWIGTISEAILYNFTLATARQSVERSQGAYYGITVP